jgi:nicotinate-nucleotide adenylyltransferase
MRVGFFGGSFDPPHLGHLVVAREAASAYSLDRVLFAPTARQPLKPNGAVAPFDARLDMVALLCNLQPTLEMPPADRAPRFEPSRLDAPLPDGSPNYTVDTLTRLRATLQPVDEIFAILGADAFKTIAQWRSPHALLELAQWIVVSRPGASIEPFQTTGLPANQSHRVHLIQGIAHPSNATEIRTLLRSGSNCEDLLPPSILHYIRAHHLYGT